MTTIDIKNASGKKAGTAELAPSVFAPVRALFARPSGPAAAPCSARIRVPTRSM